jgi:hypothetical protein
MPMRSSSREGQTQVQETREAINQALAHASTLIRAGIDVLTIAAAWATGAASMTLDVYGHLMGGADEAAADAIAAVLK